MTCCYGRRIPCRVAAQRHADGGMELMKRTDRGFPAYLHVLPRDPGRLSMSLLTLPAAVPLLRHFLLKLIGLFTTENCYATPVDQSDYQESKNPHCPKHNDGERRGAFNERP
jgi:hypothetical protein